MVLRRIAPTIGFVAGLAAAVTTAHAQTNIDQGKSPAEIFAADCATCHKTARGLAVGKNSLMLTSFLREHYTASRDQAAALAAYVLGAGGREPAPPQKPAAERARATGEEPKTGEAKGSARPPARASAKPEEDVTKPEERITPTSAEKPEARPATATRTDAASSAELPEVGRTTSAAVPAESQPSEAVPRDHIPD